MVKSLDHPQLPVRVQAALALTEMILVHEEGTLLFSFFSYALTHLYALPHTPLLIPMPFNPTHAVKTAVAPQVGKVIQDLLKLSDETDLEILNRSMEVMVDQFQTELLPVAAQLTARLVCIYSPFSFFN